MLEFRIIEDDSLWDSYVTQLPIYSFLNSSARFKYNTEIFEKAGRVAIFSKNEFIGICNWFKYPARFPNIYTQHSPLFLNDQLYSQNITKTIEFLQNIAKENGCDYVQIAPLSNAKVNISKIKTIPSPIHNIDSLVSRYFDLTKSIEELRSDIRPSTRNTINKLVKDPEVTVKIYNDGSQLDLFFKLLNQTQMDKKYQEKPEEQFRKELQNYIDQGMLYSIVGYINGEPTGIRLNVKYGKVLSDYQASITTMSRNDNRRIAYRLVYETMILGKELGCEIWDMFGGMVPEGVVKHPWSGIAEFKMGFGGYTVSYNHPLDIPINTTNYSLSYFQRYIRAKRSGFPINW